VRPDKLRFDFTHGAPLTPDEVGDVEDMVNDWIKLSHHVRAIEMERAEAERLGAMALFGEKYGDWVRVVEVDEVSRELCGGTHVGNTGEVGIFKIVSEGSSAANVRRIEAVTGPAAIDWFRGRSRELAEAGALLGSPRDPLGAARRASERLAELEKQATKQGAAEAGERAKELESQARDVDGLKVLVAQGNGDQRALLELGERLRGKLGDSAVVLGGVAGEKVALVAMLSPAAVARGLSAAQIVREAAPVVGGGGGGRDDVAQAGGRDPAKLDEALATASTVIERELSA
jgi:alanyl-tRNA synthetase